MTKEYYERVAVIARYILDRVNEFQPDVRLQDRLKSALDLGPNPYRPSIDDDGSLLIEFSYGLPSRFYTPLGGFDFCGEGVIAEGKYSLGGKLVSEFIEKFDLKEVFPVGKTGYPNVGPVLSVGKDLLGNDFAESKVTTMPEGKSPDDDIDFDVRNEQWNELRPNLEAVGLVVKEAIENIEAE